MTIPTFVAGQVLTASQVNNLAKQVVVTCTSGTRPSSPPEGMTIYETDTDKLLTYTTATTGWVAPWNTPWGRIGSAASTAATSSIGSSNTDVNGLSVTWTAVANRYYLTTVMVPIYQQTTAAGVAYLSVADGSNNEKIVSQVTCPAGSAATLTVRILETVTAGSTTRKARIKQDGGGGATGAIAYASNYPATILVEDLGPSAAPA